MVALSPATQAAFKPSDFPPSNVKENPTLGLAFVKEFKVNADERSPCSPLLLDEEPAGSPQPRRPEPVCMTSWPVDPLELEELEATPLRSPTEDPPRPASVPPLSLPSTSSCSSHRSPPIEFNAASSTDDASPRIVDLMPTDNELAAGNELNALPADEVGIEAAATHKAVLDDHEIVAAFSPDTRDDCPFDDTTSSPPLRRPEPVPFLTPQRSTWPSDPAELEALEATPLRSATRDPRRPASVPPLPLAKLRRPFRRRSVQSVHIGPRSQSMASMMSSSFSFSSVDNAEDATAQTKVNVTSFSPSANGNHVDFEVHVSFHGRSWTVKRRYAEFVALHKSMVKQLPSSDVVIDDPKTVWAPSWKKKNAELCQKRCEFFHRYLKLLVCQVDLWDERAQQTSICVVPDDFEQPYVVRFNSLLSDFLEVAAHVGGAECC